MSAAFDTMNVSTHNVGVGAELDIGIPADLEIVVYGGLDPVTQELIDNVKEAVEKLYKDYGIEAVFVPRVVYWDVFAVVPVVTTDIPILVINGKEVVRGRSAKAEEIVELALSMLGIREKEGAMPLPVKRDGEIAQTALIA